MNDGILSWMAWTGQTKLFFGLLIGMLVIMAVWEVLSPTTERRGFLPMATTRGDRFFIALLTAAFVHMAWLALTDITLWGALGLSLVLAAVIGRWG